MSLWGGRFSLKPADAVAALSKSTHFDWRLAPYDVRASLAHLSILQNNNLISPADAFAIYTALKELQQEVSDGTFHPTETDEDVHSALERGLTERLGLIGSALRAGRSRNSDSRGWNRR